MRFGERGRSKTFSDTPGSNLSVFTRLATDVTGKTHEELAYPWSSAHTRAVAQHDDDAAES